MKTYKIYVRNAETKFRWYFVGTTRAVDFDTAWHEAIEMGYRDPDSEFRIVEV